MNTLMKQGVLCAAAGLALLTYSVRAGSITYDFSTDPTADPNIQVVSDIPDETGYPNWLNTGGNPGGFLVLSYAGTYQTTHILFPDLDPGKVVTSFTFECDMRVGNGTAQPADGFSINFARASDPIIENWETEPGRGYAGDTRAGGAEDAPMPETGSSTGIALCFDTWSGNPMPDGSDLVGIMVRVDNKTLPGPTNARGFPMPTFNGACNDATSAQTGPRDTEFWDAAGDIYAPEAWDTLCWQKLKMEMDDTGKLTVIWKGTTLLDKYQTAYFPTPGRLIFGGRTGGSHEQTHIDNIVLTTTAIVGESEAPTAPTNLAATPGARRIVLDWTASQERPDPSARVAYQIEKDGAVMAQLTTETTFDDRTSIQPGSTHTYRVRAVDLNQNESDWASVTTTALAESGTGWVTARIYDDFPGATVDDLYAVLADPKYPNSPDREIFYLPSLMFGTPPAFSAETYGDTLLARFAGTITPPETGQYRFFVASDDSSLFYLNTGGTAVPDPNTDTPLAQETDCCDGFVEPGTNNDDGLTSAASEPVALTAGQEYGFLFLVKEATGGDGGAVAWRKEGDTTAASSLAPISGAYLKPSGGDPMGASVTITRDPADTTVIAHEPATFTAAADFTSPWVTTPVMQWYKNGSPIPGANGPTLRIPLPAQSDSGAKFKYSVSVPGAEGVSKEATLTVNADNKAPSIVAANVSLNSQTEIEFSEPVGASAEGAANYAFDQGVTISGVARVSPYKVALIHSRLAEDAVTTYQITVNGVQDTASPPNTIAAGSKISVKSNEFQTGSVLHRFWENVTVNSIQGLQDDPRFPNAPTLVTIEDTYEYGPDGVNESGSNYGNQLIAWFLPPSNGDYVFFTNSDDPSNLYLSTDESPANKKLIAQETAWSDARMWVSAGSGDPATKRSDQFFDTEWPSGNTITLQAGKRYYMESLHTEGGGGDSVAATFIKSGEADPVDGDAPKLTGAVIGTYVGASGGGEAIFTDVQLTAGNLVIAWSGGTLESADAVLGPWTVVPNAASPSTIPVTGSMKFYRVR